MQRRQQVRSLSQSTPNRLSGNPVPFLQRFANKRTVIRKQGLLHLFASQNIDNVLEDNSISARDGTIIIKHKMNNEQQPAYCEMYNKNQPRRLVNRTQSLHNYNNEAMSARLNRISNKQMNQQRQRQQQQIDEDMDEHCRKDSNISNMNVRMGLKNRVGGGSWQNNNCPFPLPIHIEGMTGSGYVTQAKTLPPLKSNYQLSRIAARHLQELHKLQYKLDGRRHIKQIEIW